MNELVDLVKDKVESASGNKTFLPCDSTLISQAESVLSLSLPTLLKDVLTSVGNGGFGPGYGIVGIGPTGYQSDYGDLINLRKVLSESLAYPIAWPDKLIPLCEWGSNIYSCVHCETTAIWLNRNNKLVEQPFSLENFFCDWMSEDDTKYVDWGTTRKEKLVRNPATGQEQMIVYRVLE